MRKTITVGRVKGSMWYSGTEFPVSNEKLKILENDMFLNTTDYKFYVYTKVDEETYQWIESADLTDIFENYISDEKAVVGESIKFATSEEYDVDSDTEVPTSKAVNDIVASKKYNELINTLSGQVTGLEQVVDGNTTSIGDLATKVKNFTDLGILEESPTSKNNTVLNTITSGIYTFNYANEQYLMIASMRSLGSKQTILVNNDGVLKYIYRYGRTSRVWTVSEKELATNDYVDTKIADLINGAPETLDTLFEIANALQDDDNAIGALVTELSKKADKKEIPTKLSDLEIDIEIGSGSTGGSPSSNYVTKKYTLPLGEPSWVRIAKVKDVLKNSSGLFTFNCYGLIETHREILTTSVFSVSCGLDEEGKIIADVLPITQAPEISGSSASGGAGSGGGSAGGSGEGGTRTGMFGLTSITVEQYEGEMYVCGLVNFPATETYTGLEVEMRIENNLNYNYLDTLELVDLTSVDENEMQLLEGMALSKDRIYNFKVTGCLGKYIENMYNTSLSEEPSLCITADYSTENRNDSFVIINHIKNPDNGQFYTYLDGKVFDEMGGFGRLFNNSYYGPEFGNTCVHLFSRGFSYGVIEDWSYDITDLDYLISTSLQGCGFDRDAPSLYSTKVKLKDKVKVGYKLLKASGNSIGQNEAAEYCTVTIDGREISPETPVEIDLNNYSLNTSFYFRDSSHIYVEFVLYLTFDSLEYELTIPYVNNKETRIINSYSIHDNNPYDVQLKIQEVIKHHKSSSYDLFSIYDRLNNIEEENSYLSQRVSDLTFHQIDTSTIIPLYEVELINDKKQYASDKSGTAKLVTLALYELLINREMWSKYSIDYNNTKVNDKLYLYVTCRCCGTLYFRELFLFESLNYYSYNSKVTFTCRTLIEYDYKISTDSNSSIYFNDYFSYEELYGYQFNINSLSFNPSEYATIESTNNLKIYAYPGYGLYSGDDMQKMIYTCFSDFKSGGYSVGVTVERFCRISVLDDNYGLLDKELYIITLINYAENDGFYHCLLQNLFSGQLYTVLIPKDITSDDISGIQYTEKTTSKFISIEQYNSLLARVEALEKK